MKITQLAFRKLKTLIVLLLLVTMSSCNGQQTQSKKENSQSFISTTVQTNPLKDDLFFIEGQLCQHLRKIFQDSKGNLWFGTNVYDLMVYNGTTLQYITEKEGFSGGRVTGILEDKQGTIWFATANGLSKYNGKSFTNYGEENGLASHELWCLILDSKGMLWMGHNEGISSFDGTNFKNIHIPKPKVKTLDPIYYENRITSIVEDKQGNFWLGTDGYGICKYDGESFTSYTKANGLPDNTISELMIDANQNLWIGSYWGGLSMFNGEKLTHFTKEGEIKGVEISALYEDPNDAIWIGVENNGVYKYNGKTFTHFNHESFLGGSVLSIYKDRENRFWFGGWGGLFRYDKGTFLAITKNGPWE